MTLITYLIRLIYMIALIAFMVACERPPQKPAPYLSATKVDPVPLRSYIYVEPVGPRECPANKVCI